MTEVLMPAVTMLLIPAGEWGYKHIPHGVMSQTVMKNAGMNSALASVLRVHHGESVDSHVEQTCPVYCNSYNGLKQNNGSYCMKDVLWFIGRDAIVAHNAKFDM